MYVCEYAWIYPCMFNDIHQCVCMFHIVVEFHYFENSIIHAIWLLMEFWKIISSEFSICNLHISRICRNKEFEKYVYTDICMHLGRQTWISIHVCSIREFCYYNEIPLFSEFRSPGKSTNMVDKCKYFWLSPKLHRHKHYEQIDLEILDSVISWHLEFWKICMFENLYILIPAICRNLEFSGWSMHNPNIHEVFSISHKYITLSSHICSFTSMFTQVLLVHIFLFPHLCN